MATCYICSKSMDSLVLDGRDNKTKPCSVCENVIQENLAMISKKGKLKGDKGISPAEHMLADPMKMFAILEEDFDDADYSDLLPQKEEQDDYYE